MTHPPHNAHIFTRDGKTAEFLQEVIASIPPRTDVSVIGGAARNAVYFEFFHKPLPQRDYDLLCIGDMAQFVQNIRRYGFVYGKIRRKHEIVLKKKLIAKPKAITDYFVLDIDHSSEPSVLANLKANSAFTINGFAIPLRDYLAPSVKKHVIALPGAIRDLRNKQLRVNVPGYRGHPGNLFACLRFMSIGFAPPPQREVKMLLERLPKLEQWRFERNVKKVFNYVGGEKRARALLKRLGITTNVFDICEVRKKEL